MVTSQAGGVYQPIIAANGDTSNAMAPDYGHAGGDTIVRHWTRWWCCGVPLRRVNGGHHLKEIFFEF